MAKRTKPTTAIVPGHSSQLTRKSLGTQIREALEARALPLRTEVRDGRLMYQIDGVWLTPGETADRLAIAWVR